MAKSSVLEDGIAESDLQERDVTVELAVDSQALMREPHPSRDAYVDDLHREVISARTELEGWLSARNIPVDILPHDSSCQVVPAVTIRASASVIACLKEEAAACPAIQKIIDD